MTSKISYKSSGVDVVAGDNLVDWLQSSQKSQPHQNKIVSGIGGFASLFRMDFSSYQKPCLVTCTDGVGTKVKIAAQYQRYEGVGQDLVAMCVNDLICTGGDPLMFLDYYATGKLDLVAAKEFLKSVRSACEQSNCALVGGETAEMPGVYSGQDFDCAGFAVGIVDEEKTWGAHKVQDQDVLIAVASSGFHSNGYSLLRKVFEADMQDHVDDLLIPTALYVQTCSDLKKNVNVHAAAHITGGGMENLPRVLPANSLVEICEWELPEKFKLVQDRTGMSWHEMVNTLNCGIGFVVIVPESDRQQAQDIISKYYKNWILGKVTVSEKFSEQSESQIKYRQRSDV